MEFSLAGLWLAIIGFFLLYYVVSDGFGLGVGILCLFPGKNEDRKAMMESVGYIWHTNQTWLVVVGGMLFGAFPLFYSILFSALYIPAVLMLVGLIFRGIALDFHEHSRSKRLWARMFGAGSLVAGMAQGLLLGGLLSGIHVRDGHFAGGVWDWANPLSFLVCLGVVAGYVLLGCNYLVLKTEGDLQKRVFGYARFLFTVTLVLSSVVLLWINMRYSYAAGKWTFLPDAFYRVLAASLTALAFFMLFRSLRGTREAAPFFWNAVTVVFSFVTLSISVYPYMIPHVVSPITVHQAAASSGTLAFMLVVTGILIPVMVFYTTYTHRVFRGKVKA
ncbi:MAG: cytochrome d ubiquinol oxidase subunit II [Deltaproteobacteria bacterium]|nr:cytochrome d ubiquinol oxidase subunit II [Deltaproteobacteria bacterium]